MQGEKEQALQGYDQALLQEPDNTAALLGKGDVLSEQNDLAGALLAYGRVLALEPDNLRAMLGRGDAFLQNGLSDKALPLV